MWPRKRAWSFRMRLANQRCWFGTYWSLRGADTEPWTLLSKRRYLLGRADRLIEMFSRCRMRPSGAAKRGTRRSHEAVVSRKVVPQVVTPNAPSPAFPRPRRYCSVASGGRYLVRRTLGETAQGAATCCGTGPANPGAKTRGTPRGHERALPTARHVDDLALAPMAWHLSLSTHIYRHIPVDTYLGN